MQKRGFTKNYKQFQEVFEWFKETRNKNTNERTISITDEIIPNITNLLTFGYM